MRTLRFTEPSELRFVELVTEEMVIMIWKYIIEKYLTIRFVERKKDGRVKLLCILFILI